MQNQNKPKTPVIVSVCFCLIVATTALMNIRTIISGISSYLNNESTFEEMTHNVVDRYSSNDLWNRNNLININGLFMRMTGRRSVNQVTLLKNGMLSGDTGSLLHGVNDSKLSEVLPRFSGILQDQGIPFLFVQAPCKYDLKGELLPAGLQNYSNICSDHLMSRLNAATVNTLDLRPDLAFDQNMIEKNFYKTDHHWNSDGAFRGFQLILRRLHEMDPSIKYDLSDSSLWERHIKEDWFLGTYGKRVGVFYGGVDPLIWYTPLFDTGISCLIPAHNYVYKGTFEDANIRSQYLDHKDYFNENPNAIYIGGSYPISKYLNPKAPNQKRVLIIKDSFAHSVQTFMSTHFSNVVSIDARYYTDSSILEYCLSNKPDIVVMMLYVEQNDLEAHSALGLENASKMTTADRDPVVSEKMISIPSSKNNNFQKVILYDHMKSGESYQFSFSNISLTSGKTDVINIALINNNQKKVLLNTLFDIEYSVSVGDTSWYFNVPDNIDPNDDIQLVVYAGVRGHTKGIGVEFEDVQLLKIKNK